MIQVVWNQALREEYEKLFATCVVNENSLKVVDATAIRLASNTKRYKAVAQEANHEMPWWFVACLHHMECNGSFDKHLHNGDPLTAKTTHVPAGRPPGKPGWLWEDSAYDALVTVKHYNETSDWTLGRILYTFEGYNGYGYRQYHPTVLSPYLWSFTNHYSKGKYIYDGKWDGFAVSRQIGIAAILKRMFQLKLI
jgi:lysozyme family protein